MSMKRVIVAVVVATLGLAGVAVAGHVTAVPPATVPTGFLAAHIRVAEVPVSALARAVKPDGADVFVQHVRLGPGEATGWHTHPGPAIVAIAAGSLTYQDAGPNACRQRTYEAGNGFVDPGFGHVHRAIAGAAGVDFYVTYVLPAGSASHVIGADQPEECAS